MNGHGIETCACGAIVRQCRCMEHSERRVVQQSCAACTQPVMPTRFKSEITRAQEREAARDCANGLHVWEDNLVCTCGVPAVTPDRFAAACEAIGVLVNALAKSAPPGYSSTRAAEAARLLDVAMGRR